MSVYAIIEEIIDCKNKCYLAFQFKRKKHLCMYILDESGQDECIECTNKNRKSHYCYLLSTNGNGYIYIYHYYTWSDMMTSDPGKVKFCEGKL